MTYLESIILGVLEGMTEFLPVSSTGHLILASHLLGMPQTEFLKTFEIAIQLGSILAVVLVYWKQFLDLELLKKLVVAFLPTGIVGFTLYRFIKDVLIGDPAIVAGALIVGGIVLLLVEWKYTPKEEASEDPKSLTYKQSLLVGSAQCLAMIPGVSRSGATVAGGLLMGLSRSAILSFSFLLAVPTMAIATAYDLYKNPEVLVGANLPVLGVGFVTAFLVGLVVVRFALSFVRKYSFVPFALYRIALGLVFWFVIL